MNKPLPRSRFGAAFNEGWDRIFGKKCRCCGGEGWVRSFSRGGETDAVTECSECRASATCEGCGRLLEWYDASGGMWRTRCACDANARSQTDGGRGP